MQQIVNLMQACHARGASRHTRIGHFKECLGFVLSVAPDARIAVPNASVVPAPALSLDAVHTFVRSSAVQRASIDVGSPFSYAVYHPSRGDSGLTGVLVIGEATPADASIALVQALLVHHRCAQTCQLTAVSIKLHIARLLDRCGSDAPAEWGVLHVADGLIVPSG